jgi:hypothetical protein
MDFTLTSLTTLLKSLQKASYQFQTLTSHLKTSNPEPRTLNPEPQTPNPKSLNSVIPKSLILLRHDVDLLPQNSLATAKLEHSLGIRGTYYFRIVPQSLNPEIIREIASLGHEIGYHYEDLDLAHKKLKKYNPTPPESLNPLIPQSLLPLDLAHKKLKKYNPTPPKSLNPIIPQSLPPLALTSFEKNLSTLRKISPITSICMHGSPRSPYDNKDLWKHYNYRDYGIIGEPYLDLDFNEWFYLTDTGRRWDGWKTSVRDKMPQQEKWVKEGLVFHSTKDIIYAAENGRLPKKIMIAIHPQRWTNNPALWTKELVLQQSKNLIKKWFYVKNGGIV